MSMTRQEVFRALADGREKELRLLGAAMIVDDWTRLSLPWFKVGEWSIVEPVPVTHYCDRCGRILCGAHTDGFAKGEGWVHDWNNPRAPVTCPACLALKPKESMAAGPVKPLMIAVVLESVDAGKTWRCAEKDAK